MNITELSVKRPTAIIMGIALILGAGIVGYLNLGADLFPAVNTPILGVHTTYIGAGSEEIDKDVIKPIEDAVSGVNGIDMIRSVSGTGYGYTLIQFKMSTNVDSATLDVQKALDGIADKLPRDSTRPVLVKYDINSLPILIISLAGNATDEQLYNAADTLMRDLQSIPGVGNVSIVGGQKKQLLVTVDKAAMDYYGLSATTLLSILQAENLNVPAGQLEQTGRNLTVRLVGEFSDVEDVRNLRVPLPGGGSARLAEVAHVSLDYPEPKEAVRLNGSRSIGLFVRKQSDANVVNTAEAVKKELGVIAPTLPAGMTATVASDSTIFINSSLAETRLNLLESIITTSLVLFLFLRRWRSSLIVLIAIPISLVGTFFFMWTMHFTLNIVTLMALGLCIGILVDDSIVILENIDRHIQLGEDPRTAAVNGRREIAMAAIAITLCDVVVFAPIAFMTDLVGQFFKEFGLTVVAATLLSLLVSFTVTPMMASRMLLGKKDRERLARSPAPVAEEAKPQGRFGQFFDRTVKGGYRRFLEWSLDHRAAIIVPVTLLFIGSVALLPLKVVQTEFMPTVDQNKLVVDLNLGPGAGFKQTDAKVRIVEEHLRGIPEVEDSFAAVGSDTTVSTSEIIVKLVDKSKRRKSQSVLARELRAWGRGMAGVDFSVTEQNVVSRTSIDGTKAFILNVSGPSRDVLRDVAARVEGAVRSVPGAVDVDNTMNAGATEVNVRVDRLAASVHGLTTYDIARVIRTALAGTNVGVYRHGGDEYDMVVRYDPAQLSTPQDVGSIRITNIAGQAVALSQVASLERSTSTAEILRRDRQNVATISANIAGRPLGAITDDVRSRMKALQIPAGYKIAYAGDQQNMAGSFNSLVWALVASLLLVFMILVVLYESFLTPVIRMLSIPCGIIGAFVALALTGKSINLISFIGIIMLDGLISKNGTLLIDYTNTLVKRGKPLREALVEAGITRLRPILMTSVTMIVGMLPLALSIGASSELRSGMAFVLIGGLVTSTILTPILLPVVYTIIDEARQKRRDRKLALESAEEGNAS